jgi:hypothetical protein
LPTEEGERRGCLDLQLSVMCAQTWNKREAKKSMQVVAVAGVQPPLSRKGKRDGSTAWGPVRGQWHKGRCLRCGGTQKHKREGERPVLHWRTGTEN